MREVLERIRGLLRQGQDKAALKLVEEALADPYKVARREAGEVDVPLELAFDPHARKSPELPSFVIENGTLMIDDEFWVFDDLPELTAGIQNAMLGRTAHSADSIVRRHLRYGVAHGTIRKRGL